MRIKTISIKNYRSIKDQTITYSSYNVIVGPNGSGKSTILQALNLFFGEQQSFSLDDYTDRDTTSPIEVSLTFDGLSQEAIEEFKHYVRHNRMTVVAEVTCLDDGQFKFTRRGERLVNPEFSKFFELPRSPVAERKEVFAELQKSYPELENQRSGDAMEKALRDYEENMPESAKKNVRSSDEFFGISRGTDRLRKYITWVYVPAVKDAASESEESRNTHLGRLIQHTVRSSMDYGAKLEEITNSTLSQYEELLSSQQQYLAELERRLSQRLEASVTSTAGIELRWRSNEKSVVISEPSATVRLEDRGFKGDVRIFGHGLQRAFLLAILQELLGADSQGAPNLVLGCEEPELYQHPPQVKHFASVFKGLSKEESQVILTTHSPYFVDIESLDGLIKVSRPKDHTEIKVGNLENLTEKYNECFEDSDRKISAVKAKLSMQLQPKSNELVFSDFVVLVEGISDRSYLETFLALSGRGSQFRRLGCNIIEAGGKSSLILLQLLASQFDIPHYVIFDCDGQISEDGERRRHEKDNITAFRLAGLGEVDPFPAESIIEKSVTSWANNIEDILDSDLGSLKDSAIEQGRKAAGHLKDCRKNPFFIVAYMEHAWKSGCKFETLQIVVDAILAKANEHR
ncbi:MAG: ATP-dependent endonuclease [Rhodospirillaceae bacterium]|nr:ATP-dependent endonuclease [Rhodospirillaceae bacterium]